MNRESFEHRLEMCKKFAITEGTEIGDIVSKLAEAAIMLWAFEDYDCQIVLITAERMCNNYCKDFLMGRQCDWEEYESWDSEVYSHFTGGARKLTQEEFERRA